jgi:hypothetical protein
MSMKNFITDFTDKWANRIMFPLVFIIFLKTCSTNSKIEKTNKDLNQKINKIDSIVTQSVTKTDVKIEGLKSEKRMIQSTDRTILDVNRQTEIDKEIQELEK